MANKVKKISINAFEKVVNDNYSPTETVEWEGLSIIIKRHLGLQEMLSFVDEVTKNCFREDNAKYLPELRDFAINNCLIEYYTNLSLPSNVEKRYELIYHSGVIQTIVSHIDCSQFDEMVCAINAKISNIARSNIEAVNRKMNEVFSAFENLQDQFGDMFDGIDKGTVSAALKAIGGGFDEEKIVKAVMDNQKDREV